MSDHEKDVRRWISHNIPAQMHFDLLLAEHAAELDRLRQQHADEVDQLRRIVDGMRSKTAIDVVAEKMQAQDELREARAENERLRQALVEMVAASGGGATAFQTESRSTRSTPGARETRADD